MSAETPGAMRPPCPGETEVLSFVSGVMDPAQIPALETHLVGCHRCHRLIAELARDSMGDGAAEAGTASSRPPAFEMPRTLQVGEHVGTRYDIRRFIARGGMGEVYEAHDTMLDDVVALKTLIVTSLDDERAVDRLKDEILVARRVSHPNVCRLLEFGVHKKTSGKGLPHLFPYLTMELLQGQTLRARLHDRGPFAVAEASRVVLQLLDALAAIHAARVVHRDVKCDNIFLVPLPGGDERVVLTDLGLAREMAPERRRFDTGAGIVGTVDYMAPEQLEGEPASAAFDIYALGVVLFHMLTGQLPFSGGTAISTAARRMAVPAPRLSDLLPTIDPRWDAVVARCLQRDPAQRFNSVAEIQAALTGTDGSLAPAHPRRRMAIAGGVSLAAVAILLLVVARIGAPTQTARPSTPIPITVPRAANTPVAPSATHDAAPPTASSTAPPIAPARLPTMSDQPSAKTNSRSAQKHGHGAADAAVSSPSQQGRSLARTATADAGAISGAVELTPRAPPPATSAPTLHHPDDVVDPFPHKQP